MKRKPRRHALSVPVRHGSVGSPTSLGRFTDMLYDKSLVDEKNDDLIY